MAKIPLKEIQKSEDFEATFLPGMAIDTVIFGFHEKQLKILLLRYHKAGLFGLPAGFIKKNESLDAAAKRVLYERTGLKHIYLEQYYTFGDLKRFDPRPLKKIMTANGASAEDDHWLLSRFISVGYYALVDHTKAVPLHDDLSDDCDWYDLSALPKLMLDHEAMKDKALATLRENLDGKLIGFNLMPETFTMAELQSLYETILGQKQRRTSFQRKILNMNILERLAKKNTGGAYKSPYLYRFAAKSK
ncbi:MAG: NUDIX domain-containing protein [Ginsengibacter sp.]